MYGTTHSCYSSLVAHTYRYFCLLLHAFEIFLLSFYIWKGKPCAEYLLTWFLLQILLSAVLFFALVMFIHRYKVISEKVDKWKWKWWC